MRINTIYSFIIFLLLTIQANGQEAGIPVKFTDGIIKTDGVLDESAWEEAVISPDFWQYFPSDSVRATYQTHIRLLYDDNYLYAGIRAEKAKGDYVISSLRRDFSGTTNDNVVMMFDPFRDGTNAYVFGVTPYGVKRDIYVSEGGANYNTTWDVKWQVETSTFDDHYIVEIAIPMSSLKYREGDAVWRFQCYRWNIQSSEQSALSRVPQNQLFSSLAFMTDLVFEKPLGKSKTPFTVIPYMNGLLQNDYENGTPGHNLKFGGDAKIAIGNAMNLDITVNPDFSNVEIDDIFTNLTRFEVFLPEKRQFFIDNSDLFGNFGSSREAVPFFSRRIGLASDTSGNLIENRIIGGVRLSGKLSRNWRLGFLNMQTAADADNGIPSNNNMMLAVQRRVFSRSNIAFFVLNRQSVKDYDFLDSEDKYNRVMGIDYNLASADNTWTGKFYVHKSFQPDDSRGNYSSQATLTYNSRKYNVTADIVYVDSEFRSDLGFIPRKDYIKSRNQVGRSFYPQKGSLNRHTISATSEIYWRPGLDYRMTDRDLQLSWDASFRDQSTLQMQLVNSYIFLTRNFDPTRTEGALPLPGDTGYNFSELSSSYQSSMAKKLTLTASSTVGQFYNGQRVSLQVQPSFRIQPWVLFSLVVNYNAIRLPDPYPDADLWLISPDIDVTFSKSVFWSTLIQYSNQGGNLGINSRLQWRFAPLSDLYLVYNDNYFTENFGPRFRSINLKLTYWLNI